MKKIIQRRLLILLIIAAALMQPVFAESEDAGAAGAGPGTTVVESAYKAASEASSDKGEYFWRITPSGEPVKCRGGLKASPAGNLKAEAPKISAEGAALYSYDLGQIIYSKNENKRLDPYSTTKLLTCWLALENLDQDTVVTISEKASQPYENGTTIWLKEGEKIPVRDLLYGAMLESGNDAAYALGEAVAGSEKDFAELMNQTVREWGCSDTNFVNANGWKHKNHYSTAHDMAIITAKCLENPQLREIATAKKYTAPATNLTGEREMKNYFLLVTGSPDGITGGKTGTWDDDDCAVVCSFSEAGIDAVIVVLGDTKRGRPKDVRKLMAFSHEVTPGYIVPAPGSTVESVMVKHGEKTRTTLVSDGVTYAYPEDNNVREIRTELEHDSLEAPVKRGQEVGKLLIYCGDELIGEHKLLASEDIDTGWLPSYLYISNQAVLNALKVLGIFVVLLVLINMIGSRISTGGKKKSASPKVSGTGRTGTYNHEGGTARKSSRKEKKETRKRLREKYREKH